MIGLVSTSPIFVELGLSMKITVSYLKSKVGELEISQKFKNSILRLDDSENLGDYVCYSYVREAIFQLVMLENGLEQQKDLTYDNLSCIVDFISFIEHGESKLKVPVEYVKEVLRLGKAGQLMVKLGLALKHLKSVERSIEFEFLEFEEKQQLMLFLSMQTPEMVSRLLSCHWIFSNRDENEYGIEWDLHFLLDTCKSYLWLADNNPASLQGISRSIRRDVFKYHNFLYKEEVNNMPDYDLPDHTGLIGDHVVVKDQVFKVFYPTNTKHLKNIGKEMNHCVATYAKAVAEKECIIIQLYGENNYTLEITPDMKVNQNMGYGNIPGPSELTYAVEKLLLLNLMGVNP